MADIEEGKSGVQYKTIAGPIGLTVEGGEYDGGDAVKKYAAIIDANAVGGWELLWIQQIPVTKITINIGGLLGLAAIAAAIGYFIGWTSNPYGRGGGGNVPYALMGALIGAGSGLAACRDRVVEFFNMLVFVKRD